MAYPACVCLCAPVSWDILTDLFGIKNLQQSPQFLQTGNCMNRRSGRQRGALRRGCTLGFGILFSCFSSKSGFKSGFRQKKNTRKPTFLGAFCGGGDGSRTHVRKEFSAGISGCRRSTTFPPRHADRQASALVAS